MPWTECRTGNVLIKRDTLHGLDPVLRPEFGGGASDQDLFRRLVDIGHRFVWCNEAVVYEVVPLGRDNLLGRFAEEYQERTFKADYALDYGMPQWLAKVDRLFSPLHLERLFLGRHKYCHFRYWYRKDLARCVKETLRDPRSLSRPYVNGRRVERMVEEHTSGRGNYTIEIHLLLTTERIQRQLVEQR